MVSATAITVAHTRTGATRPVASTLELSFARTSRTARMPMPSPIACPAMTLRIDAVRWSGYSAWGKAVGPRLGKSHG